MRYKSTGEVHLDFHGTANTTIDYITKNYGVDALKEIFKRVGGDVYRSIHEGLVAGDASELIEHWGYYLEREGGDFDILEKEESITLTIKDCPAVRHVKKIGLEVSEFFCEQTISLNEGLCSETPYEITTKLTGEGKCVQTLRRRTGEAL